MKSFGYILILFALGCNGFRDPAVQPLPELGAGLVDTVLLHGNLSSRQSVRRFYALRNQRLMWSANHELRPTADSLIQFIRQVNLLGLDAERYHVKDIVQLQTDSLSTDRWSQMDVFLTDAWLTLYAHIAAGQLDAKTYQPVDLSSTANEEAVQALMNIHADSVTQFLRDREPRFDQYRKLKDALKAVIKDGEMDSLRKERAAKLALNLERWRWQKRLPNRYVSVNVPAFMLRVFENDSLWLEKKVIVGKRETPTPVMESVIRSFIIYPYWHVPKSISTKEILPALQQDAGYLGRNNFDVLDRNGRVILADTIQWDFYGADNFPFILRQREGAENSMGIIKFNFANNYGVYLHDTNSKRLFARSDRDLSHGCVRVSNAVAFAHYLVREDDIYVSPEDLDQYLSLQQRLKVDLRNPVQLRLEYFTVEVKNGTPVFYDDIYKKDSVMYQSFYPLPGQMQVAMTRSRVEL